MVCFMGSRIMHTYRKLMTDVRSISNEGVIRSSRYLDIAGLKGWKL